MSLGRAFEFLISRGHRLDDLLEGYTIDQFFLFLRSADKNVKDDRLDLATRVRIAFHATGKDWQKYMAQFMPPKILTPEKARDLQRMMGHGR